MEIKELLIKKASFQKNAWSKLETEISINQCLAMIRNCILQQEIEMLRGYLRHFEFEKYNLYKKRLPGVTFSSTFLENRKLDNIKDYNSILVIDIDKINESEIIRIKDVLNINDYILSFWESPSKNGIKGLVHLDYTNPLDKINIHHAHRIAFRQISDYFLNSFSINIDQSGNDITRLCFLSADPNLVIKKYFRSFEVTNSEAETDFAEDESRNVHKKENVKTISFNSKFLNPIGRNLPQHRYTIKSIIKYLTKRQLSITSNYEKWYRVAYAIANTFTYDIGEKYYLTLCRLDFALHDEEQSRYLLNYSYEHSKGEITFSTIVYLAKQLGYKDKGGTEGA